MADDSIFATLSSPRRTWAVGAVHGEADRLGQLHDALISRIRPGDNLVYLGNFLGRGPRVKETVDELLNFRRAFMARIEAERHVDTEDVVFLRGAQEEMWHKLLQIQFAPNPTEVLDWMLAQGVGATIRAYGGSTDEGKASAREGAVALTQWTNRLRDAMRALDGHNQLLSALRRAAFTADHALLFVSAGIDPTRPLSEQTDAFWWGGRDFASMETPYGDFTRVVRGFATAHPGLAVGAVTATVDGGAGFGGPIVAACFEADGTLGDSLEA
jgi:serine/threonine protein phosphatase 1